MKKISEEVYLPDNNGISLLNKKDLSTIQKSASISPKHRSRLCLHGDNTEDPIQEMIIVHHKGVYVRPHRHTGTESFHIIKGQLDVILLDALGTIIDIIPLSAYHSGNNPTFCYRLNKPIYHTLIVKSRFVAIHEVVNGPFKKENSQFPAWAPAEEDKESVITWKEGLMKRIADFKHYKESVLKTE